MSINSVIGSLLSFIPGSRLVDGGDALTVAKYLFQVKTGLTALAGGGQTGATALAIGLNQVDTVATTADSVMLPPAIPGSRVRVYNGGANSMQVFGQGPNMGGLAAGDQVCVNNSVTPAAVATGVAQASTVDALYTCYKKGIWKQSISA